MMEEFTSTQKAAILLLTLGPEASAQVMKHLSESEIESITQEITQLRKVTSDVKERIVMEFHDLTVAHHIVSYGGLDAAKDFLVRSFGEEKANSYLNRLGNEDGRPSEQPFGYVQRAEPMQILNLLQNEKAQTIALVLSYLDAEKAATILSSFSPDRQIDIAKRIATMDTATPEFIVQVEQVLNEKLSMTSGHQQEVQNGVDSIVSILNNADRGTEKNILERMEEADPELANEIKQRLFVFDDIANLDNRSIQRILMEVSNADLPLALRMAGETVKDAIYRNISKRRLEGLQEELLFGEPVQVKEVEEAQSRIVSIVRKLEQDGVIIIARSGEVVRV